MDKINVAVLGATGAVGESLLRILAQQEFPVGHLYPLASARSQGASVSFCGKTIPVQDAAQFDFSRAHIAFFSAGASVSAHYAPLAAQAGCVVIDNTSQFRLDPEVPLVVSEVNPQEIAGYRRKNIIANPNCSTIQMLVALKPIYDAVGISRINVATYQSVSGTGDAAIRELNQQSRAILAGEPWSAQVYPVQIGFNLIPHIDVFEANGYTREEMKMVHETRKILNDPHILVNPTTVRVPVFVGHSEAIHLETRQKLTADAARALLAKAPGVVVKDDPREQIYPTPAVDAAGKDPVFVGRIREDLSHPLGLNLWVVADNIRKGAALNSVQIAQILVNTYF